jgi:integrase
VEPPRYLSRDDADKLLEAAPPARRLRYRFLISTGVRLGEAQRAVWEDINFEVGQIRIRNAAKGAGPRYAFRTVALPALLLADLQKRRSKPKRPIFEHRRNWLRDLRKDLKAAKVDITYTIHDLRHTCASWLAQAGISLHRIRDLLGHSSVKTTERYGHQLPSLDAQAAQVFGDLGSNRVTTRIVDITGERA